MKDEPIKHEKPFPPSASAGGDNAYYLRGCDTVNRSPAYASCLFKISEFEAGRDHEIYRDCYEAIRTKKCRAISMREQEQLQGVALYYFPRKPPQALLVPVDKCGEFGVRISNLTPPDWIPKDPKPSKPRFAAPVGKSAVTDVKTTTMAGELAAAEQGYAAAINAALNEPASVDMAVAVNATPAKPQTPPPAPKAAPVARPPMQAGESPLQYARRIAAAANQINQ